MGANGRSSSHRCGPRQRLINRVRPSNTGVPRGACTLREDMRDGFACRLLASMERSASVGHTKAPVRRKFVKLYRLGESGQ